MSCNKRPWSDYTFGAELAYLATQYLDCFGPASAECLVVGTFSLTSRKRRALCSECVCPCSPRFQQDMDLIKIEMNLPQGTAPQEVHDRCRRGISTWTGTEVTWLHTSCFYSRQVQQLGPGLLESGYFVEMVQLGPWMEDLRSLLDVCPEGAQLPEKVGWAICG